MKKSLDIFILRCYTVLALGKSVKKNEYALVAQLDRVFDYESKGRGFEPLQARQSENPVVARRWDFRFV